MNERRTKWMTAKEWWTKQETEKKRYLAGAFVVVIILCFGLLPDWLKSLSIFAAVAAGVTIGLRIVKRRKRANGNNAPLNAWIKLLLILVGGLSTAFIVVPTVMGALMGSSSDFDAGRSLIVGALMILSMGIVIIVTLILAIRQGVKAWSGRNNRDAPASESEWEGADAKTLEIVRILRSPKLINQELYKARLFVNEKPVGLARVNSSAQRSITDTAFAMYSARAREGAYTVNGEQLTVPRLVSIARTAVGPVAFFTAIPGATENTYDYAADILEVSMRVNEIRVAQLPEDRARGVMRMTFVVFDPLRVGVSSTFFDEYPAASPMLLPLALTEEGGTYSLPLHHTLVVGATGSGKGGVIQGILRQLVPWQRQGYVRIFGGDPKRAELKGFERSSIFERVTFDLESIAEMAEFLVTDVLRPRQEKSGRSFVLSTENPLVLFIIDELSSLTQSKNYTKSGLYENLNIIMSQGRSDGVYVVAASQVGQKEVLGELRQHFANRVALRLDTAIEVDMVLGAGSMNLGALPHLIPKANESNGYATAGVAYVNSDESPRPLRIRFPYTSDEDIQRLLTAYPTEPSTEG
jgi:hypothetical protein